MSLLAACSAGVFAYLAVGYLTGYAPPNLRFRGIPRGRRRTTSRQQWLLQAGARVSVRQFWATSAAAGALTFVIVFAITGATSVALFPALAVAALPRTYYARERTKRGRLQVEAWPDALRSLVASLNATLSLHQALVALGYSGPTALRPVFIRYAQLSRTLDARAALEAIRDELADPVSDRVAEVLLLANEQGPSIVLDILGDLARATTADLQLIDRIETAQVEQKLNARAVFVLPYFILVVLCASAVEFRSFYQTGGGLVVVAIGAAMSSGGMAIINRLGRIPAEQRLFVPGGSRGVSVQVLLAALAAAATAALAVSAVVHPTRQLGPRVAPYAQLARSRLGRSAEVSLLIAHPGGLARNSLGGVFGPVVIGAANRLSALVDAGGEAVLSLRLRQAGFSDTSPEQYRMRQLACAVGAGTVAGLFGAMVAGAGGALLGCAIGLAWGASYWRGRVNSAIKARTARMRVELYTVAQLLAMLIRTGHGPVQAMQGVVRRTQGAVIDEIAEALRWMAGGMGESEALERLAEDTAEPAAARLYRLLSTGIQAGGDLGQALLAVSDELRAARREDVERTATARRGTMLIPTIVVMAPVVMLFIVAPLPSVIFGAK